MTRYVVRRLLLMVPTVLIASMLVFALVELMPGDAAAALLGGDATPERVAAMRHELGLDQPLPLQYVHWLARAVVGDLGRSAQTRQFVSQALIQRLPVTLELSLLSLVIGLLIGIPAGVLSAARRNSAYDQLARVLSQVGVATPDFWLGVLLVFFFALVVRWFPASGFVPVRQSLLQNLRSLLLPSLALGLTLAGVIMRMTRSSTLEILQQEYIMVARAKGLRQLVTLLRHALKLALLPVLTVVGVLIGRLLGGVVIIEEIFQLPGIGRLAADSIFARDYSVLQGVILFVIIGILVTNLLVDLCYRWLDPRIRYG